VFSVPKVLGAIAFAGCFTVIGVVSAVDPVTPNPAADGNSGTAVTQNNVGSGGTPVAGGWGDSGNNGADGGVVPAWDSMGDLGEVDKDAGNGKNGVVGGQAGKGGAGGSLTINVTSDADFATAYPSILGTTGGNGGNGGTGGIGQTGGGGYPVGALYTPQKQSVLNGANGGQGGLGATGVSGGNGGNLIFDFTGGTVTFADGITFGGTAGIGGSGGQGGKGGNGGNGAGSVGNFTAGLGGNGGDGGNGGIGGNGGTGGNATFTIANGTLTFQNATFGGKGGKGGNGGLAGTGGNGGLGGDADVTLNGIAGSNGLQGNGGNGGNGGSGNVTISSGTANFTGTTYFGGLGGEAGTGSTNGTAGTAGNNNSLTLNGGTLKLGGNVTFRGTNNTVAINSGTLSYDGDRTIDAGSGTVTVAGGTTLSRTSATGILTVNANSVTGPATGQIILDIQGNGGQFLASNVAPSNLTTASFNVDNYRLGTEVKETENGFELILGGGALPFEWLGVDGGGNGKWKLGSGSDRSNWDNQEYDFATGDIANFKGQGQGDVTLVGLVNPGKINISAGIYDFKGEDGDAYLSTPELNVTGSGTKLTISNTKANNIDLTNIGNGSEIAISRGDALGNGTVNNNGTLNVDFATDTELANILAGTGTVEKNGNGKLILTGNSTATGGKINVAAGSLQVGDGSSGSYNGDIDSATDVTFNNDNATTFAGTLSGTMPGGGKLVKEGSGALTLSGSATSGVRIDEGSIVVGNANALGSGTEINSDGTLDVNGINVASPIDLNGGSLVNNNATAATVNNVTLSDNSTAGGNGHLTIDATLTGGYDLEKTGTGTITLTQNNVLGTTTVSGGKLELAGTDGSAGDAIVLGNGTALVVNRNGDVGGDISGTGNVEILKDVSLTGTTLSYTGQTTVTGVTLTGGVSSQSDLLLTQNATYNLGAANRAIKSANVESGSQIALNGNDLTVTGTLEVIATQNEADAPIQGGNGELVLAAGSTLKANLANDKSAYQLAAGGTTPVYFADNLSGYTDSGATVIAGGNRLFRVEGGLNFDNGNLYYNIKRNFAADLFPNISPQLAPVIDNYSGNNNWVEYMMTNEDDDSVTEKYVQGGLDLVNLSNAMSVLYDTQSGIDNILYSRSRHFVTRSSRSNYLTLGQCDPCGSVLSGSGSDREFYVTPIYANNRGYNLSSGNFRYGYINDQWAMGFGVDQSYGRTRVGLLGIYGEGKALLRGTLPRTINETSFGGLVLYANTHRGNLDLLFSAGYLGMENSVEQFTSGNSLSGKISNGLATFSAILTQTLRYDGLYVLPTFGIEYGYYHQGSLSGSYGNEVVVRNDKSHANLAVIPVGVRLTRNGNVFGGRLNPEFRARYIANVGGVNAEYNTYLTGSPDSALMATRMTDRHAGDIGLGFGWTQQAVVLRGDVGYLFSEHYSDLTVSASASWKF
jgi:hypothetical protein